MYDNLDLVLYKGEQTKNSFLDNTPGYLSELTSEGISQFGHYINGYLGSLKISITEKRIKIHDSSICKYYLGNNFKTLNKGDTKKAIEKISDTLHQPFNKSTVTRIDFSSNIITKYPANIYYQFLGEAQYYKRLEQNNGLYYNNGLRQILFYGKVHEQKEKKIPIPELYIGRNVLRYELRFRKKLKEQFRCTDLLAEKLYDETFYYNLIKRWKNEYLEIQKINSKLIEMRPTGSKKELIETLALFSILEIGQPKILNKISEWQEKKEITKKQAYDLRKSLKDLSKIKLNNNGNELIDELTNKIKQLSRYA